MNAAASCETVRVLGIIPARGGSKGVPRKNIALVCGKPLLSYAIQAADGSKLLDACIVSTDDVEIQTVAQACGGDAPFLRPEELATDEARDIGVLQHALDWVERERGWKPEVVVLLPPTSPSRTSEDIDSAISLLERTGASSVRTAVHPPHFNPHKMWVAGGEGGRIVPLHDTGVQGVPRQQLPEWYMPVGFAYVMRVSNIRAGDLWGKDVRVLPVPLDRYTDIDSPDDLETAADILKKHKLA